MSEISISSTSGSCLCRRRDVSRAFHEIITCAHVKPQSNYPRDCIPKKKKEARFLRAADRCLPVAIILSAALAPFEVHHEIVRGNTRARR